VIIPAALNRVNRRLVRFYFVKPTITCTDLLTSQRQMHIIEVSDELNQSVDWFILREANINKHSNSLQARDIEYFLHPYTNLKRHEEHGPLVMSCGKGIYVYDTEGKPYIEGLSGLWCTALGFGEPRLVGAASAEMAKLPFFYSFFGRGHDVGIDLAEKLISISPVPMSKVSFTTSGSEANDTAVKLVWYFNNARGLPKKKKIISRLRAYHGATITSASLGGLAANHQDFDLPIANILHTECPHYYRSSLPGESEAEFTDRIIDSLEQLILREGPETIAAFIAEPIMGAGGVIVPPPTYFEKVQSLLRKYDVLFICDEVITGFGRTGKMWGAQTCAINPDMITMAKALTSAYLPLGALLVSKPIYRALVQESEKLGIFGHGYTHTCHPVCAAVALEAIKIYEERNIVERVRTLSPLLQQGLRQFGDHPLVGEVRGVGLMGAVELVQNKSSKAPFPNTSGVGAYFAQRTIEYGLIVRAIGDTIALAPPLIIEPAEIHEMLDRFGRALNDTATWVRNQGLT
jgi:4-aminobutyrate--pyruvate transaminase